MAKNIIVINRGDTYPFNLTVDDANSDDGRYHLTGEDAFYFFLMLPNQPFEQAIIKKYYVGADSAKAAQADGVQDENGNLVAVLTSADTIDLYPGVYYYSVKLEQDHDEPIAGGVQHVSGVMTVIDKTKFIIND